MNAFRVLVVDDNQSLAEALADIFEARGYETAVALDGLEAIEHVRSGPFDCVLMDIRMPKLGGVLAYKEIRKLAPNTPVILMTAYSLPGLIDEARDEGVLAVLQKPVAINKILEILTELKGTSSALIVDSPVDPDLCRTLTERGYRVVEADNVTTAIERFRESRYDVILLNLEIQGMTADSVLLFKECDPKSQIILMSSQREGSQDPRVCATLQKPFKMKEVVALLDRIRALNVAGKVGIQRFEA